MTRPRTLVSGPGHQPDLDAAFDGFDPARDAVRMAEADEESTHVWSSKQRLAIYLAVAQRANAIRQGRLGMPA